MTDINTGEIIIYNSQDGQVKINLHSIDNTVWLNQAQIAELFDSSKSNISEHITNILNEELDEYSVVRKFRTTATDGKEYLTNYYSLDMILAVGFRVRSPRENSDIDICLKTDITTAKLSEIKEDISNSNFAIKSDIVVWNEISQSFQDKIKSDLVKVL